MAKALSLFGVIVALTLVLIFSIDVALGKPATGEGPLFMGFSKTMDVGFIIAGVLLGYISFMTFRELP